MRLLHLLFKQPLVHLLAQRLIEHIVDYRDGELDHVGDLRFLLAGGLLRSLLGSNDADRIQPFKRARHHIYSLPRRRSNRRSNQTVLLVLAGCATLYRFLVVLDLMIVVAGEEALRRAFSESLLALGAAEWHLVRLLPIDSPHVLQHLWRPEIF